MAVNRAVVVDQNFASRVSEMMPRVGRRPEAERSQPAEPGATLSAAAAIRIFESQIGSRHLDLMARQLRASNASFYTIGSSGHEGNAAVAAALEPSDMAFLHYRSGGFYLERARQVPGVDGLADVMLGVVAARDEPIAGGRHKVFGRRELFIPPQTSTIASHLPKALGAAISLDRMRRLRLALLEGMPQDSIIVASFGDASVNHSTAAGAINGACWSSFRNIPVPLLMICEDNGLGISVSTPRGWVTASMSGRPGLRFASASGLSIVETHRAASSLIQYVRTTRRPAFLHLDMVRLLGHAGSDVEQTYRSEEEIEQTEANDPLLHTARLLVDNGWLTPPEVLELYAKVRDEVRQRAEHAVTRPRLESAQEVVAPLAPQTPGAVEAEVKRPVDERVRRAFWDGKLPEEDKPRHLAVLLNRALGDTLVKVPEALIFGEDVSSKGGVYHVTAELQRRAGVGRVFDTLLDEQSVLGLGLGAGHLGCLPIPEIQYLAYYHNAEDQIRGEAASLQFFSNGQYRNPMVVRIASFAYQKGFGGHFHNDNSVAALRDIPGLIIACPSRGDDAVRLLRTCVAAARVDGAVCAFLEPIALYMTRDLYEEGDGLWTSEYPKPGESDEYVPLGKGRTWGNGADLTVISFANGVRMSLQAARTLEKSHGIKCRVLDLRWLNPLPVEDIVREARATGHVLVVDETRRTGGVSEAIFTALIDAGYRGALSRITSEDTFIPLGPAADHVLVQPHDIVRAALTLLERTYEPTQRLLEIQE